MQSFPDTLNLQVNLKKWVVRSLSYQEFKALINTTKNKMGCMQVSCTLHFKGNRRYNCYFEKLGIKQQSLIIQVGLTKEVEWNRMHGGFEKN